MTPGSGDETRPFPKEELAALFESHRDGLGGAVRSLLGAQAETLEVLQEAFLKAWRALDRGDRPREILGWIYVVVINTARDHRRRQRGRPRFASLEEEPTMPKVNDEPDRRLIARETAAAARRAIEGLGDAEKEVFLMRVSAGLSFEGIAASLDIPTGTAKTRMRRALQQLRASLGNRDERSDA
ncbi:MAG: RNA polymerase sigma factor [Planctomycetes bacterium]|nr:RNA polymerase sigma factor [Planctomycetota bacterium]